MEQCMIAKRLNRNVLSMVSAALLLLAGCSVDVKKDEEGRDKKVEIQSPVGNIKVNKEGGKDKNVSITSPFGSLKVDTATEAPEEDNNQSKANVNIDSPWFTLKVQALKYRSNDPQDKIWEYYKKELKKYGRVLECKPGSSDMNITKKNEDDLTCHDDHNNNPKGPHMNLEFYTNELRVGTQDSFRVIGVKPDGKGSSFALIRVRMKEDSKDAN